LQGIEDNTQLCHCLYSTPCAWKKEGWWWW